MNPISENAFRVQSGNGSVTGMTLAMFALPRVEARADLTPKSIKE